MSLTTYSGLIAEIWADLDKDSVTNLAESWIAAVESRMNAELRVRQMIQRDTATISSGFSAVPGDFLAPRQMRLNASPYTQLKYITQEQMADFKAADPTGTMAYYAMVGGEFEFGPAPTSGVVVVLTYYQQVPPLTTVATSNWMLAQYPLAYKTGALVEAGRYYRDAELINLNEGMFQSVLESIRLNSRQSDGFYMSPTPSAFAV